MCRAGVRVLKTLPELGRSVCTSTGSVVTYMRKFGFRPEGIMVGDFALVSRIDTVLASSPRAVFLALVVIFAAVSTPFLLAPPNGERDISRQGTLTSQRLKHCSI